MVSNVNRSFVICMVGLCAVCVAEEKSPVTAPPATDVQLTIYNQKFAVVKERRNLELRAGVNEVRLTGVTAHMEPDSVILRDVKSPGALTVLEQNYESDPLSQGLLLMKNEGREISFEIVNQKTGERETRTGKIIRSGYVPHTSQFQEFDSNYRYSQQAMSSSQGGGECILEMDGKIRFGLPGTPIFDKIGESSFLKPTLLWKLDAETEGTRDVELSYITGGMKWEATYNLAAPESGDRFSITGWVTMSNQSGMDFENASVKLMAGDVSRAPNRNEMSMRVHTAMAMAEPSGGSVPVGERAFDDYHLYDVNTTTTVRDREVKQVQFLNAADVSGSRLYVYDGAVLVPGQEYNARQDRSYGTQCNNKVSTMLEFVNSEQNHLGMPLPQGEMKLYRRDRDSRNEFIGEDRIDHTPKNEKVRVKLGKAFDLFGERKQTDFRIDTGRNDLTEKFEIKIRNHKKETANVRVVEHLYRWLTWEITEKSQEFEKKDARTVEFPVTLEPEQEKTINYTVYYRW